MARIRVGARLAQAGVVAGAVTFGAIESRAQPVQEPARHASAEQHPLGLARTREGSGTAWLPDASPMHALHGRRGAWEGMLHGSAFLQYLDDGGPRGVDQLGSVNWVMAMARRPAGKGRLGVNLMMSLEPWTVRGCGYPDLLATGEFCSDRPIVDRQHPHDLFMELAATYDRPIGESLALQIYGGPAGEPALGPVAYPHRVSALPNLLAPISHHWLDATHITFGVVTAGVYGRRWKAEASLFNGREPDADRLGIDLAAMDSAAGRVWYAPTDRLVFQVSAGRLTEAEPDHEGGGRRDVDRSSASATYHRLWGAGSFWASTVAWGRNAEAGDVSHFVLAETSVLLDDRHAWFGRVDVGGKSAHDLEVADSSELFTVAKLQGGYVRYFGRGAWTPGVGASVNLGVVPAALEATYGGRASFGFGLFVTVRPAGATADNPHAGHQQP